MAKMDPKSSTQTTGNESEEEYYYVEEILQTRLGDGGKPEYLIKWEGYEETSWASRKHMRKTFKLELEEYEKKQECTTRRPRNRNADSSKHNPDSFDTSLDEDTEAFSSTFHHQHSTNKQKNQHSVQDDNKKGISSNNNDSSTIEHCRTNHKRKVQDDKPKETRGRKKAKICAQPKPLEPEEMLRGRHPEKILEAREIVGERMFLVKYKGTSVVEWVPIQEAKAACPKMVFGFFDKVVKWLMNDGEKLPGCRIVID